MNGLRISCQRSGFWSTAEETKDCWTRNKLTIFDAVSVFTESRKLFDFDRVPRCMLQHDATHARFGGSLAVEVAGGATQPDPALAAAGLGRYVEELVLLLSPGGHPITKAAQEDHRWGVNSITKLADANNDDVDIRMCLKFGLMIRAACDTAVLSAAWVRLSPALRSREDRITMNLPRQKRAGNPLCYKTKTSPTPDTALGFTGYRRCVCVCVEEAG